VEVKQMTVGAARLLCETPLGQDPEAFAALLRSAVALLQGDRASGSGGGGGGGGHDELESFLDEEADAREFDSTYSKLAFALVEDVDATKDIPSAPAYFAVALAGLSRSRPGQYLSLVQASLDAAEAQALQEVLAKAGVAIE